MSDKEKQAAERDTDEEIAAAKCATSALFLSNEASARSTGLRGYHELLHEIFPSGKPLHEQLVNPAYHVFTFNYDRLFEVAFLDHFSIDVHNFELYGQSFLNSGILEREVKFEDNETRFSFLKLHGSVGMHVAKGIRMTYEPEHPRLGSGCVDDNTIFGKPVAGGAGPEPLHEPLLAFPHEKHLNARYDQAFGDYLDVVWGRAKRLIANAGEVWVAGYSFSAIDWGYNLEHLFGAAEPSAKIVIQNPHAAKLCTLLELRHPKFKDRLVPYAAEF